MDGGAAEVRFEIHPSIGIARVGTSAASFLGPEPDQPAPTNYRDDDGALLRQAARFRVFECERDEQQALISAREVTGKDGAINWTVHLVNRKATGNKFAGVLRNATHPDRTALVVDPGPRSLTGSAASARPTSSRWVRLADPSASVAERQSLLGALRKPGEPAGPGRMPRLNDETIKNVLPPSAMQYETLTRWAAGSLSTTGRTPCPATNCCLMRWTEQ